MHGSVPSPPTLHSALVVDIGNRISPSLLLVIIILAVIFFVSGVFHLLVRCWLMRPIIAREPEEHLGSVTVLQGQLRQLFHLHDAGVDQSLIDTLPVFLYKAIVGLKDPFDCAVCLCEFEPEDKLRLLPKCSHAFHLECIDTWLLSHSTCPLCRSNLLNGCCSPSPRSPMVLVLESASETASGRRESTRVDEDGDDDDDYDDEEASAPVEAAARESAAAVTVAVKLGKFKSADAAGEEATSSTSNIGNSSQRRCFSMGSYEYVMEDTRLRVSIEPPKKPHVKKSGHRIAMSECDCHSRREGFRALDRAIASQDSNASAIANGGLHLKESFSASKIWLQAKEKSDTSRRAISFRLPLNWAMSDRSKPKANASPAATAASEFNVSPWGKNSSEVDLDVEAGSSDCRLGSRADEAPSFTRRTLLWLVGRQNRVGNHL